MIFRTMNYGYACTRVSVLKSKLLSSDSINSLLKVPSPSEVIRILEETEYSRDLDELSINYKGVKLIELALGRNMAREFRKICYVTPSKAMNMVLSLLGKWDVHNIKVILLGRHLGYAKDDIKHLLVPAGDLNLEELNAILERRTVEDVVNFLWSHEYGKVLAEKLGEYKSSGEITPLLIALDAHFYQRLHKILVDSSASQTIKSLIRSEIDIKNIMVVMRSKEENIDENALKDYLIAGGHLSEERMRSLIDCKNVEEIINKIRDVYDLTKELENYAADKSIAHFEKKLEKTLATRRIDKLRHSVLSAETLIGYVYMKEEEVNNIRKITRAKEFNIPLEEIKDTLVLT